MKLKLLVVDDSPEIRSLLKRLLDSPSLEVLCAEDGEEIYELIEKERPDVVLLDLWMPKISGIFMLKKISKSHPEIAVMMMSGDPDPYSVQVSKNLGALDFIEKPISVPKLQKSVRDQLQYLIAANNGA